MGALKTYAVGFRAGEVPLDPPPFPTLQPGEELSWPATRASRRKMFRQLDPTVTLPSYGPVCADSNDPQTVANGFAKRVMRDVPQPQEATLAGLKRFVRQFVEETFPVVQPLGFEQWLARTPYPEPRKDELRRAHDSLRGGLPNHKQCSKLCSFEKTEGYAEYKWPRLINSRSDAFKTFAGPAIKAVEDVVYSLPQFVKHVPVPDRPAKVKALKQAGARYFATDFTAFESHFTGEVMEALELQLYEHCLQNWKGLPLYLKTMRGLNKMQVRRSATGIIRARRMSGDMCTSLGNGFSNLMLAKYIAYVRRGSLDGLVEGDDGLFVTDFELLSSDYEKLGFTIKCEEVDDPCTASFCGMVFSESGEILRDPRRFAANFGWTHSFVHAGPRVMKELLRAKALSAAYETPCCPIVTAFVTRALALTGRADPRFVYDGYHDSAHVGTPGSPSRDTRELFARLYGISVAAQERIEQAILHGEQGVVEQLMPPGNDMYHYTCRYVQVG